MQAELNAGRYFDFTLRAMPGPYRTFRTLGEVTDYEATREAPLLDSFRRRIEALNRIFPPATSATVGSMEKHGFMHALHGATFDRFKEADFPDFFRTLLHGPIPSDIKLKAIDIHTSASFWASLGIVSHPQEAFHVPYYFDLQEQEFNITNGPSFVIINDGKPTFVENSSQVSTQDRVENLRFANRVLDVIEDLLDKKIPAQRSQRSTRGDFLQRVG